MNPTIQLASGGYWDIWDPESTLGVVDIETIAHALSNICRFTGHTRKFYSVAQHAVLCSRIEPEKYAYAKLMHDIAEAMLNDVASPLKRLLPDYKNIEANNEGALLPHFGIDHADTDLHHEVKRADLVMLATEKRDLMPACPDGATEWVWLRQGGFHSLPDVIRPWGHVKSKHAFLARFYDLCPERFLVGARWKHVWGHRVIAMLCL